MKTTVFILMLGLGTLAGFCKNNTASAIAGLDEEKEKMAIIESINAETSAFYKRNYEEVIKYFVHADYAFHAWNNADGTYYATVGWPAINEKYRNYIKDNPVPEGSSNHPKVVRKKMIFKFYSPELAFVTYDEYTSDQEIKKYWVAKAVRIMEKHDGIWKIANMTAFWDYKNQVPADSIK